MSTRADSDNYRQIFLNDAPLIDVRAPVEFAKGSFPTAVNLPLMTDREREQVGITYKEQGQAAAIECGHTLVGGAVKATRVAAWADFARAHPNGYLFCFRGGLRSQISRRWLAEAGTAYPLIKGGYKALRRFLIGEIERLAEARDFLVVAGRTGVGKTLLLDDLPTALDLEGLANHRGSSFGRRLGDQPSQINFENSLAIRLVKIDAAHQGPIVIEDESPRIGQLALPLPIATRLHDWPTLLVEEPLDVRVNNIHKDYVTDLLADHVAAFGDAGFAAFATFLLEALHRVRKRLGGERYASIHDLMATALDIHGATGDDSLHRYWIETLLRDYYDPMYDYQLTRHPRTILFRGTRAEALAWHRALP